MLYQAHRDPFVLCLQGLVYRDHRYTIKDLAFHADVDRTLVQGWMNGKPAPLAQYAHILTKRTGDSAFLDCLVRDTRFRVVTRSLTRLPELRIAIYSYFTAQREVVIQPGFRKIMDGKPVTKEEADKLRQAIKNEREALDVLEQWVDAAEGPAEGEEKKGAA